jgi:hypothetical protein
MLFSPRDYVIAPTSPGYSLVQIHKSPDGLSPGFVTAYDTWEEASRKVYLLAVMEGVHAWGRRDGEDCYCELVMAQHPHAPWPEPWQVFDRETVEEEAPRTPGVYVVGNGRPMFAGETDDLRARLSFHLSEPAICLREIAPLLFSYRAAADHEDAHVLLRRIVRWWKPPCNSIA